MPFVRGRIVIDFHWRGKGRTVIRAAREHHVCAVAVAWRPNTAHHVNVVVRRSTRAIHCQKDLRCQPSRIYIPAGADAAKVDLSDLFEDWRLITDLRVAGANGPKLRTDQILAADEKIAIRIHVSGSMYDTMGNIDRTRPGHATIGGTAKFARGAGKALRPKLVLKPVARAVRPINREPLLIASTCPGQTGPGLATVIGLPDVVTKCLQKGEIKKRSRLV